MFLHTTENSKLGAGVQTTNIYTMSTFQVEASSLQLEKMEQNAHSGKEH